jgi:hypothetical protein
MNPSRLATSQYIMAVEAVSYPVILHDAIAKRTASQLEKHGYGHVESGASGQVIFRLSPDGADMLDPQNYAEDF